MLAQTKSCLITVRLGAVDNLLMFVLIRYGDDFLTQLEPVYTEPNSQNGGFITSCLNHVCPWTDLSLENKSTYEHYSDWYYGRTEPGKASMHIDLGPPNGNGTLSHLKHCHNFC